MAHRRFPYDSRDVPSLDMRVQAQGGSQFDFAGTVDSGASRTVLSRKDAELLGLESAGLRETGTVVVADGSKVRCWTTPVPIRAQVLQPSPSGDLHPWGPVFNLDTVFLEHASPLWGQADFFATFEVTFWRNANPATFGLGY